VTPRLTLNKPTTIVLLAGAAALAASPALAQTTTGGGLTSILQNVVGILTNGVVRLMAILAIMATAATWMAGHLDLRRAMTVVGGIAVIFSAAAIADSIFGSGATGN
jgi:type IV secretory pathway VirB2 component (pilin)